LEEVAEVDPKVPRPTQGAMVRIVPMAALDSATGQIERLDTTRGGEAPGHLRRFLEGDVLLAKISPSFENGKVAVAPPLGGVVGFGSSEFHVLRAGGEVSPAYLWLILRQRRVREHLAPTMSGRAGQQRISVEALRQLAVPVPPSESEQSAIVALAQAVDSDYRAARDHVERALAGTEEVRSAIRGDITFSAAPWEQAELRELVVEGRPIRYGIVQPGPEYPGGVPYARVRDFVDGSIATEGLGHTDPEIAIRHEAAVLRGGDLLVSIRGTVGELAVVPEELDGIHTTQDAARISVADPILREWLALVIASPFGRRWLDEHTSGRAVQGVNVTDLRLMEVPLPPKQEMARRVELAENALRAVDESVATVAGTAAEIERVRETVGLAITLGRGDVEELALVPPPSPARSTANVGRGDAVDALPRHAPEPVSVPDDAPPLVRAIAQNGGSIEASALLAQNRKLDSEEFYRELWEAVQSDRLRRPEPGSSLLELADAP
jgi:type I restriction enzyme S subunit